MSPGDPPTAGDLGDLESAVAATGTAGPVSAPSPAARAGGEGRRGKDSQRRNRLCGTDDSERYRDGYAVRHECLVSMHTFLEGRFVNVAHWCVLDD